MCKITVPTSVPALLPFQSSLGRSTCCRVYLRYASERIDKALLMQSTVSRFFVSISRVIFNISDMVLNTSVVMLSFIFKPFLSFNGYSPLQTLSVWVKRPSHKALSIRSINCPIGSRSPVFRGKTPIRTIHCPIGKTLTE